MCEDSVLSAKSRMLELFSVLDEDEICVVEQWITSLAYKIDLEFKKSLQRSDKTLIKIGNSIKKLIPFEAEMPSEVITPPTVGDQADCNNVNTCHVDEFLYDADEVENLVKKGLVKTHYCTKCSCRDVQELICVSHSMSREHLQYIFKVLLPSDLEGKQVLDVGSRLGAVLYGAYHYSNAGTIVGVEMNKEFCDVQKRIIEECVLDSNRIQVVQSDILERSDLLASSDIIIVNILDFFVNNEQHKEIWRFFKKHIKKGTYLISNRSMSDTMSNLDMFEELIDWLKICKPNQLENEVFCNLENCSDIHLYTVK